MPVRPITDAQTLESLRDSDFDSLSALGEVVDNSIQAEAKSIRVQFVESGNHQIKSVTFIDDGKGMNSEVLQNCLRLGWSSRFNDRSGIGRFGVGMTLGAVHECRRVEVYSKDSGSDWHYTYLDLDEITQKSKQGEDWLIPSPTKLKPTLDDGIAKHLPQSSGTVVVWSKYDRASDKAKVLIEEFRIWLGRTYRYFIWNESVIEGQPLRKEPLTIYLQGKEVHAIDPLYIRTEKTGFQDDPIAHEFDPIVKEWPIRDPEVAESLGVKSSPIRIRMTLLPEAWRTYQGQGNSEDAKKRHIDRNEGFSIVRHGREVSYDWIPRFQFQSRELDRFWGIEIHFEPCLDRSFTVKNIKRGAVPNTETKKLIADSVAAWIRAQREAISDHWKRRMAEPEPGEDLPEGAGGHGTAENVAKEAAVPEGQMARGKDHQKEMKRAAELVSGDREEEQARWMARFASQPFTIGERAWPGPTFLDIHYMGGSDALFYNTRHTFYEVTSTIKGEIRDGINLSFNAERITTLIDVLLISYAKAESMLNPSEKSTPIDVIDQLKSNWGQYLKTYVSTWMEEFDNDLRP